MAPYKQTFKLRSTEEVSTNSGALVYTYGSSWQPFAVHLVTADICQCRCLRRWRTTQ